MGKRLTQNYSTDNPIHAKIDDRFDRWSFSKRIADTIGQRDDSTGLVIGLYGEWGEGKTSVLNLMENALTSYDDIVITRFNPWYFQSEGELVRGFFDHLAETMGRTIPNFKEKALEFVKKYGGILAAAAASIKVGANAATGGVELGFNPEALHNVARDTDKQLSFDELRERIEKFLAESQKRILILIDDIDRLDKEEIQQIFKLVKLSANFQSITYVLAFDQKMVAAALKEKYAGVDDPGQKFLEKIIQVPLHLPPADKGELQNEVFKEIEKTLKTEGIKLSEYDEGVVGYEFQTSLGCMLKTPRQVKRYANAIMFAVPVLKDECCISDLLLFEAVRIFYPNIYTLIKENPEAFLTPESVHKSREKDKNGILKKVFDSSESEQHSQWLKHLLGVLFLRTDDSNYGDSYEKLWAEEKRICSSAYFPRYLNYGVPKNDISDLDFSTFISILNKKSDVADIIRHVKRFLKLNTEQIFIKRVALLENSLDLEVLKKIAIGVVGNAKVFKDNDGFLSDLSLAVSFIARVLVRIKKLADRDSFAEKILSVTSSTFFGVELLLAFVQAKRAPEEERLLSKDCLEKLEKELADLIQVEAEKFPPHMQKHGAGRLIWHWNYYGVKEKIKEYFSSRLKQEPDEVGYFLSAFVGTSYGTNGVHKSDLLGGEYDLVTQIITSDDLIEVIKISKFGKPLDIKNIQFDRKLPDDQRLVNQFVNIFETRKAKGLS
jgi:predicted KAP-like P-loop ATPase